jgi:carbamoyltransferase
MEAEGITEKDLAMVVQAANFEKETIQINRHRGRRYFSESFNAPVHTISHHLAHAYSAVGTSPFDACNIMIIDGAGSPYNQCDDLEGAEIPLQQFDSGLYCEKDSFYFFDGQELKTIFKDFSVVRLFDENLPIALPNNYHSIGGLYSAASFYCFGNMNDAGKLMGLAPYGNKTNKPEIFILDNSRVEINYDKLQGIFTTPSKNYEQFKHNFQHYADIARWIQTEVEKAILYIFSERLKLNKHNNLAYAGGVALNAVSNARLLKETRVENLYMQPAAGDNGLAIGCAYYGWLHVLKNKKTNHTGSPFLGKKYTREDILSAIRNYEAASGVKLKYTEPSNYIAEMANLLNSGKVLALFQGGAEFGPRALGHRSILADPRSGNIRDHINRNIKFREDFRPFAPTVQENNVHKYFEDGFVSPYMILIDRIKAEWRDIVPGIVHRDGTCRVQTVTTEWNAEFYELLGAFEQESGIGILLNTSFNKKGMPIVETPEEALELFFNTALDILVLENIIIEK